MTFFKEIVAIVISQILILVLVTSWLRNVYQQELEAVQSATNVLFYNAAEEAKTKLFFSRYGSDQTVVVTHDFIMQEDGASDPVITRKVLVFEDDEQAGAHTHQEQLMKWMPDLPQRGDSMNIRIGIQRDEIAQILISGDSLIQIDFDTTRSFLEERFRDKINTSELASIQTTIVEYPGDSVHGEGFITTPVTMGNILFGTVQYAAIIGNYRNLVLSRMMPEIAIGVLFFFIILAAFLTIYRNLIHERRLSLLKDELISNISHELNTPISVLAVALEALDDFKVIRDPGKAAEYIRVSKHELGRLNNLVDKILEGSAGKKEVENTKQHFIASDVISAVVSSMRIKFREAGKELEFLQRDDGFRLWGNPSDFKTVLYNLLDNALKYTGERSKTTLRVRQLDGFCEVSVEDQGPLIDPAYRKDVFDRFFRVPSHNIHSVKGHGLGLYQVKTIVANLGGTVKLGRGDRGGNRFLIRIPLSDA